MINFPRRRGECGECGGRTEDIVIPSYEHESLGLPGVIVINAISEERCLECKSHESTAIPNLNGLIASAAIARISKPLKLRGPEIKYMRIAMDQTAMELADHLGIEPETLSRLENSKQTMGPQLEKLLRIHVLCNLGTDAPIKLSVDSLLTMKLLPWNLVNKPLKLRLALSPEGYVLLN